MGKKGGWFSAVRKAFVSSNDSKDKKEKEKEKEKEKKPQKTISKKSSWFGKQKNVETDSSQAESAFATPALRSPPPEQEEDLKFAEPEAEPSKPKEPENEPTKPIEPEDEPSKPTIPENEPIKPIKQEIEQKKPAKTENEQKKPASTMAFATSRAAVAAAAFRRFLGKSKEEVAAIKVQTAFRRFSARRQLRALKGLVRLKVLVQSQSVKRQAVTTLRCMQTLARVQSQVRARRIRMSEENQALQRQLLQKRERELDNMRASMGNEWDNSRRSKEQIEASLQNKEDAAARRERALAYAQTQQQMWRNPSKSANPTFMDPNNPQWGWSWLDRWMAARPWESQSQSQTPIPNEPPPVKLTRSSSAGDMSKKLDRSPSVSSPRSPSVSSSRRVAPLSPKSINDPAPSPRNRRHSISNSSSFRDESSSRVTSPRGSPRVNSPRSTKTKSMIPTPTQHSPSRSPSPSPLGSFKKGTVEKKSTTGTVNRRLSLSGAPPGGGSGRRLSGSPKVGSGFR